MKRNNSIVIFFQQTNPPGTTRPVHIPPDSSDEHEADEGQIRGNPGTGNRIKGVSACSVQAKGMTTVMVTAKIHQDEPEVSASTAKSQAHQ